MWRVAAIVLGAIALVDVALSTGLVWLFVAIDAGFVGQVPPGRLADGMMSWAPRP